MKNVLLIALVSSFLVGCNATTKIVSQPEGARVILNEQKELGHTPLDIEAQVFMWTRHTVRLEKDGYQSTDLVLQSESPVSIRYAAVCVCSLLTLWPLGLLADFEEPLYTVTLEPLSSESGPTSMRADAPISFRTQ